MLRAKNPEWRWCLLDRLLIMSGPTQHHWVHQVPKTTKPVAERLNLTFRVVR
jgi:alkylated DNA repair dioxygenase AlkB